MRTGMIVGVALAALAVVAGNASAGVFCKKKSGVVVARDASCKSKETQLNAADYGMQGPQGPAGPNPVVGFASVAADGTLRGFGGSGTTSAAVLPNGAEYEVTFTGTFTVPSDVYAYTLLCTAESDDYQVCNAYVNNVTPTTLSVTVYTFNGYNSDVIGAFSVAVMAPSGS